MSAPPPRRFGLALIFTSVLLTALNLRIAVTSLSPLLDMLGQHFGFGPTLAGVFGMLPPAAFALFGVLTPRLAHRIGLERTVLLAMAMTAVGLMTRGFAGAPWHLIASSLLALAGAGIGNVVLPPLIKRYFPQRIGTLSALYLSLLQVGTIVPALLAVPMANALGWPLALGSWSLVAMVAVTSWIGVLARERRQDSVIGQIRDQAERPDDSAPELPVPLPPRRIWRSPLAWSMALMFSSIRILLITLKTINLISHFSF